jgi:integrase
VAKPTVRCVGHMGPSDAGEGVSGFEAVLDDLRAQGAVGDLTAQRVGEIWTRFDRYLRAGRGVHELGDVTVDIVREFVVAPIARDRGLQRPSVATMHVRRCALRLLFGALRESGLVSSDPTRDVVLPPRSSVPGRPLSDGEVLLCRQAALSSLSETRLPAAWALAEATARTGELAHVRICDVDLALGRVWLHGASKTRPRWGLLADWSEQQLARRLEVLRAKRVTPDVPLVYQGDGSVGVSQAASCNAINAVLTRAGLAGESDVRPVSVAAWAGARILAETGRVEEVAARLGMRSLDRAARLIGWDWFEPDQTDRLL